MGIFDKAKDLIGQHDDKIDQGIDKAADLSGADQPDASPAEPVPADVPSQPVPAEVPAEPVPAEQPPANEPPAGPPIS